MTIELFDENGELLGYAEVMLPLPALIVSNKNVFQRYAGVYRRESSVEFV